MNSNEDLANEGYIYSTNIPLAQAKIAANKTVSKSTTLEYVARYDSEGHEYSYSVQEIDSGGWENVGTTYENNVVTVDNPDEETNTNNPTEIILEETAKTTDVIAEVGDWGTIRFYVDKEWLDDSDLSCRKATTFDIVYLGNEPLTYGSEGNEHIAHTGDVIKTVTVTSEINWEDLVSIGYKSNIDGTRVTHTADEFRAIERSLDSDDGSASVTLDKLTKGTCTEDGCTLDNYTVADGTVKDYIDQRNILATNAENETVLDASTAKELNEYSIGTLGEKDTDQVLNHFYNVYYATQTIYGWKHYYSYNQRTGVVQLNTEKDWNDNGQGLIARFAVFRQTGNNEAGDPVYEQLDAIKRNGESDSDIKFESYEGLKNVSDPDKEYTYVELHRPGTYTDNETATLNWESGYYDKYDKEGKLFTYVVRETALYNDTVTYDLTETECLQYGIPKTSISMAQGDGHSYTIISGELTTEYGTNHSSYDIYNYLTTNKHNEQYKLLLNVVWRDNGVTENSTTETPTNDVARPDVSFKVYQTTLSQLKKALKMDSKEEVIAALQNMSQENLNTLLEQNAVTQISPQYIHWDTETDNDWYYTCDLGYVDRYSETGEGYLYFAQENLSGNEANYEKIYYNSVVLYDSTTDSITDDRDKETDYRPYEGSATKQINTTTEGFIPNPEVNEDGSYKSTDSWDIGQENWGSSIVVLSDGQNVGVSANTTPESYAKFYSSTIVNYLRNTQNIKVSKVWKLSNGNSVDIKDLPNIDLQLYVSYYDASSDKVINKDTLLKNGGAYVTSVTAKASENYKVDFSNDTIKDLSTVSMTLDKNQFNVEITNTSGDNTYLAQYDQWGRHLYYYILEDTDSEIFNTNYMAPNQLTSGDFTLTNTYQINPLINASYAEIKLDKEWLNSNYRDADAETTFELYAYWQNEDGEIISDGEKIAETTIKGTETSLSFTTLNVASSLNADGKTDVKIPYYAPNSQPYKFEIKEITPDGYKSRLVDSETYTATDKKVDEFKKSASYTGIVYEGTIDGETVQLSASYVDSNNNIVYYYTDSEGNSVKYDGKDVKTYKPVELTRDDTITYTGTVNGEKVVLTKDGSTYTYTDKKGNTQIYKGNVKKHYIYKIKDTGKEYLGNNITTTYSYDDEQKLSNKFDPPKENLTITKNWDDLSNKLNLRPDGITYTIQSTLAGKTVFSFDVKVTTEDGTLKANIVDDTFTSGKSSDIPKGFYVDTENKRILYSDKPITQKADGKWYYEDEAEFDAKEGIVYDITPSIVASGDTWTLTVKNMPTFTSSVSSNSGAVNVEASKDNTRFTYTISEKENEENDLQYYVKTTSQSVTANKNYFKYKDRYD